MVKKTALLTLGRLPKALDVAEALSKQGWRVIIAEPSAWHLCRVSRYVSKSFKVTAPNSDQDAYLKDLLKIISDEQVSLIVPISEEALHATLIENRLPSGVTLFSAPQAQLRQLHNKYQFNRLCGELNLSAPETHMLGTDAARELATSGDFIVKPACTCSGQGFSAHTRGDALPDHSNDRQIIVQERMKGALKSTFSVAHQGRVIGSVIYKAAMLSGSVAVAFERLEHEPKIENWIERFVKETNYSGFISFDMMEDGDAIPHAIECNPRATSGIHFVDRSSLASAITQPENATDLKLRPEKLMQQFYPCLTEVQGSMLRGDQFVPKLSILKKAKEVNFAWSDPLPLWLMPFTSWSILKRSIFKGETFGEASTFDIAWYED